MNAFFRDTRRLLLTLPALALVLSLVGLYLTRNSMADLSFLSDPNSSLVDQRPWQTAQALAPMATTSEEQTFAQQAERLADHEVDQAFALALREAADHATQALTGRALELSNKVASLQAIVKSDQAAVDSLTEQAKSPTATPNVADDLDSAKTQLQLDSDELSDATDALARASDDKRAVIQQGLAVREASMKSYDATAGLPHTTAASITEKRHGTLASRLSAWFDQRHRYDLVLQAAHQAQLDDQKLAAEYQTLDAQADKVESAASSSIQAEDAAEKAAAEKAAAAQASASQATAPAPAAAQPAAPPASTATGAKPLSRAARLALVQNLSIEHNILRDRRNTEQQLVQVYNKWAVQIQRQHAIVFHLILQSCAWIAFIILCAVLAALILDHFLDRPITHVGDRRRLRTLHTIFLLAIEVGTLLIILLFVFGPPSQIPTIIGLATAGLTVVFQSFILAFFGWFVLMGKNGIRVGDWVEINSVAGEVVEIGLFRTILLETGNWTDKGHPTGRRISFINNFAITGQYFNFSTAGQWMWDEITVHIPPGTDDSRSIDATIDAIHQRVIAETSEASALAEDEWQRATRQQGLSQFKASPSVDRRPASSGIDIIVRYVTRAGDRFEMRNKLYQAVIDLLAQPAPALPSPPTSTQS